MKDRPATDPRDTQPVGARTSSTKPVVARKRASRKGPGRPEGTGNARELILDAAESVFAELGYSGATLREVATKANVTQGLVSYYYTSKFKLFEAVFLRRSLIVSEQRVANLERLQAAHRSLSVAQLVEAFLRPAMDLHATAGGRAFFRVQARLHLEPPEVSHSLRAVAYTHSTNMYVHALMKAVPGLPERDAHWRVAAMVGAYTYAVSDTHRLEQYAPGICNPDDPEEIIDQLTRFMVGGFRGKL